MESEPERIKMFLVKNNSSFIYMYQNAAKWSYFSNNDNILLYSYYDKTGVLIMAGDINCHFFVGVGPHTYQNQYYIIH